MHQTALLNRYQPPAVYEPIIEQVDSVDLDSQVAIGKRVITPDAVYTYTGSRWVSSTPITTAKHHLVPMSVDKPCQVLLGAITSLHGLPVVFGERVPFPRETSTGYLIAFPSGIVAYNAASDFDKMSPSETASLSCEYEIGSSKGVIYFTVTKPQKHNGRILGLYDDHLSELVKTATNLAEIPLAEFDSKKASCIAFNSFDNRTYYVKENKGNWQMCYMGSDAPFIPSTKFTLSPSAKPECTAINHHDYTAFFILRDPGAAGFKKFGQLVTMPGYRPGSIPTISSPGRVLEVKCDLDDIPFSIAWSPITNNWYGVLSDNSLIEYSLAYVGPHIQATATKHRLIGVKKQLGSSALLSDASGAIYAIGESLSMIEVVSRTVITLIETVDTPAPRSVRAATSNPLVVSMLATPYLRVDPRCTTTLNQFVTISPSAEIITPLTESGAVVSKLTIKLSQPGVMSVAVPEGITEVVESLTYTYYGDFEVSNYQGLLKTACYASALLIDEEHLITITVESVNGLIASGEIRVLVNP